MPIIMKKRPVQMHAKSGWCRGLTHQERRKSPQRNGSRCAGSRRRSFKVTASSRMAPTPTRPGTRNIAVIDPETRFVSPVPLLWPREVVMLMMPATVPRLASGTWSGSSAASGASTALKDSWTRHQPTKIHRTDGAMAMSHSDPAPASAPAMSHGRRMPQREVVRSLRRPMRGLANRAHTAPALNTTDRVFAALSGTSSCMRNASVTRIGVSSASQAPTYASAYSVTNPQPGRGGVGQGSPSVALSACAP